LIGIQDHPYNAGFLDTWSLIATLLQATERVHIFDSVSFAKGAIFVIQI